MSDDHSAPEVPNGTSGLGGRVDAMLAEAEALRDAVANNSREVTDNRKAIATDRKWFLVMAVLLVLVLGLLVSIALGNRDINESNQDLLNRLDDCLVVKDDPQSCYQRQIKRTADIVGTPRGPINTVTFLTVVCAQTYVGEEEILDCVEKKLAER